MSNPSEQSLPLVAATAARPLRTTVARRRAMYAASMLVPLATGPLPAFAQAGASYAPPGAMPAGAPPVGPSAAPNAAPMPTAAPATPAPQAAAPATPIAAPAPTVTEARPAAPAGPQRAGRTGRGRGGSVTPVSAGPAGSTGAAPAPSANPPSAIDVLMQQANFWHAQYQDARALESLNKILALDPNNAEALGLAGEIRAEQGDRAGAQAALDKLRAQNPNDPRIAQVESALRMGQIDPHALAEARRLSSAGQHAEAVQRYQQLFHGETPPSALAVEYYQTLAGTDAGWDQAREGLAAILRQNPQDLRAQLAYAEVLTYREGASRIDGINRLARLAAIPSIGQAAVNAWRQALLWLPADASSVPLLNAYLARHADDTGIQQALEQARHPPNTGGGSTDVAGNERVQGFRALNAGRLGEAERLFGAALAQNPRDSDALGGLGIVRLREGRTAEARNLLERAIALNPAKRRQWEAALNGTAVRGDYASVRALADRGDYAGAESELRRLTAQGRSTTGSQLMLADLQARRGDLADAETSYRAVLERQPNNANALVGLAGVLQQQGRTADAQAMLARAAATGNAGAGRARAEQLRRQAANVSDPGTKIGLYRAALATDPSDPWIHLELARTLANEGQLPQARAVMAEVTSGRRVTNDDLRAGIIFANEYNLPEDAGALISRVPPRYRTADMMTSLRQAQFQRDVQMAAALPPEQARRRLLALAAAPDPDGNRGAAVAREFMRMNDGADARAAILSAHAASGYQNDNARVAYAGALMEAGYSDDAQALLNTLPPSAPLTPAQRSAVNNMRAGLAVRASDRLNQQGRQAAAYDRLAPALAQNPADPNLNLALARLYQGADEPGRALAINQEILRRNPNNEQARKAAVDAAMAAGDLGVADRLVQQGLRSSPNDPQSWLTAASLARARGDNLRALRDLERARELRMQQLGSDSGSDAGADLGADPSSSPTLGPAGAVPGSTVTLAPNAPPVYGGSAGRIWYPQGAARQAQAAPNAYPPNAYSPGGYPPAGLPPANGYTPTSGFGPTFGSESGTAQPLYRGASQPPPSPYAASGQNGYSSPYRSPFPPSPFRNQPSADGQQPAYQTAQEGWPFTPAPPYVPAMPPYQPSSNVYNNPFRSEGSLTGAIGSTAEAPVVQDPMTVEIERSIAQIRADVSPAIQGGASVRARSGESGLDQLTELAIPLEASFSPGGYGRLRLLAQPTFLDAGNIGAGALTQARFGTQALNVTPAAAGTFNPGLAGPLAKSQHASGVGMDLAYNYRWFGADIGTTPLGFPINNTIGGVELTPQLAPGVRLRLTGERRAVTDSLLSYAGAKDPRTDWQFGGVTRTRGYAQLELAAGLADFYLGGGYASLTGENVAHNSEVEAGAGGSFPVYHSLSDEVRVGLDLVYFGFDKNLRYFTLGQGGYFSPQSYFAALIPVNYEDREGALTWSAGAAIGVQTYNENSSPVYPTNAALQAQLDGLATGVPGLTTVYPGKSSTGFTGNVHAAAEYQITPSLRVGGRASFEHAGDFNEGQGLVYARYLFNAPQ